MGKRRLDAGPSGARRKPRLQIGSEGGEKEDEEEEEDLFVAAFGLTEVTTAGNSKSDNTGYGSGSGGNTAAEILDSSQVAHSNPSVQSSAQTESNLPNGWTQCLDHTTGSCYYWNTATNEVTWTRPIEPKKPAITLNNLVAEYSSDSDDEDIVATSAHSKDTPNATGETPEDADLAEFFDDISETINAETTTDETPSSLSSKDDKATSIGSKMDQGNAMNDSDSDDSLDDISTLNKPIKSDSGTHSESEQSKANTSDHDILRDAGAEALDQFEIVEKTGKSNTVTNTEKHRSCSTLQNACATFVSDLKQIGISLSTVSGLTKWHKTLIKLETRMEDVKEGQLSERYVHGILRDLIAEIKVYSKTLAPQGWTCYYDWNTKNYYYKNHRTGKTTWDYPTADLELVAPLPPNSDPPPINPPLPDTPEPEVDILPSGTVKTIERSSTSIASLPKKKKEKKNSIVKNKKLSGLVQKWAKAKESTDLDSDPERIEAERDAKQARRIEAWKVQQLQTNAAKNSVNFQPLGDWKKKREELNNGRRGSAS